MLNFPFSRIQRIRRSYYIWETRYYWVICGVSFRTPVTLSRWFKKNRIGESDSCYTYWSIVWIVSLSATIRLIPRRNQIEKQFIKGRACHSADVLVSMVLEMALSHRYNKWFLNCLLLCIILTSCRSKLYCWSSQVIVSRKRFSNESFVPNVRSAVIASRHPCNSFTMNIPLLEEGDARQKMERNFDAADSFSTPS